MLKKFYFLVGSVVMIVLVVPLSAFARMSDPLLNGGFERADNGVCSTISFEADASGAPILSGQVIDDEYSAWGITVSAQNNRSGHPDKAITFDSNNPIVNDLDLGTPNETLGGPGVGKGGESGQPYVNFMALNNLLIIAENDRDNDGDGYIDGPDDETQGGSIIFDFDQPTWISNFLVLDNEEGMQVKLVYDKAGTEYEYQTLPTTKSNGLQRYYVDAKDVYRLEFILTASAAIDDICLDYGQVASTQAYDWQAFGSGYTRVNEPHTGAWGIRVRNTSSTGLAGAYQRIDLNQTKLKPVYIGGYVKGTNIVNRNGQFGASIYVEIHLQDGSIRYWNSLANAGTFGWRWMGFNTGTLEWIGVDQPISHIFVVPSLNYSTGTAYFDDIVVSEYEPTRSAVTIMFDDGEDNTFMTAKPIMDTYGIVGTSAVVSSEIGNVDDGFMTASQIQALASSGWEIVSHAVNHDDITIKSQVNIKREFEESKKTLESLGLMIKNFAYPFGAYVYPRRNGDKNYINALGAQFYNSVRAYELGDNPQGAFPQEIKVFSVIETTTVADIQNAITRAQNEGRWIVFTFHSITPTGDDAYHTDPAVFADMMKVIDDSGIDVVTYQEGLDLFAVQAH